MSAVADAVGATADDRLARRNAIVLATTQALAGGNNTVTIALGGIVGAMLTTDKSLATLPVTLYVLGMWMGTLPFGMLARRYGRRTAFLIGTIFGVMTGALSCIAVLQASFAIYNIGALFSGFYAAAHQGYRFAAADTASEAFKPKAISWVMIGGLVAGIVGPQMVIATKELWQPYLFAATFVAQAALAAVSALILLFLKVPSPGSNAGAAAGRPLAEIARQPRFIVAVAVGTASYSMMNLVMTSAPLAMLACAHSVTDATLGIQWHVIAMFAPSFFTGALITRIGASRIAALGLVLIIVSALISMAGITLWHFWIGLIFLGVGWNFGFIGATTMVTQCHRPNERNRVQSFNDFLVFGSLAIASFSSGKLLESFGWAAVNQVVFPVVLAALALLAWMSFRPSRPAASAA